MVNFYRKFIFGAAMLLAPLTDALKGDPLHYKGDRELLSPYSTVRHFGFLLEGRDFTLFTDHKPLTYSLLRVSPLWSTWQLSFISEFTSNLVHFRPWLSECCGRCCLLALSLPSSSPSAFACFGHPASSFGSAH